MQSQPTIRQTQNRISFSVRASNLLTRLQCRRAVLQSKVWHILGALAVVSSAATAAQPVDTQVDKQSAVPATPTATSDASEKRLSGTASVDLTTGYFYRGIVQEDSGLIVQPALELSYTAWKNENASVEINVGTWNSVHGQATNSQTTGDVTKYWYEADFFVGGTYAAEKWTLGAVYFVFASPNDAFETVQEINLTAAFDDSEWLGNWTLRPAALLAFELGADASDGADSDTGTYLELSIAPGPDVEMGSRTVAVRFPVTVGLSLNNYYQDAEGNDDLFGFVSVGATASIPLGSTSGLGDWTLNAGVSVLFLGNHTSGYNNDQDVVPIGTIGLQLDF